MSTQTVAEKTSQGSRRPLLIGLAVLAVLIAVSLLTRDDADVEDPFDPRNPTVSGDQAVARVLDQHGVDVVIARGQAALLAEQVDPETAVVVTNPDQLGESTLDQLREHARQGGALVVVGDAEVLEVLFDIKAGESASGPTSADCEVDLVDDLVVRRYGEAGLDTDGCFGASGSAALVRRDDVWLLTTRQALTNAHVLDSDNGALALRLLGQGDRLVWYVADAADTPASDGVRLSALLPPFLVPALWLGVAAVLALVLWRGRRLGPLVTEPLPVVVRAAESTRSRGQIYHRTRDRQHAATVLVDASRRRLAEALRLPRGATSESLVMAVAARTGRDPRAVHELLTVPLVGKDSALVELGRRLTQLENEVRAP